MIFENTLAIAKVDPQDLITALDSHQALTISIEPLKSLITSVRGFEDFANESSLTFKSLTSKHLIAAN